MTAMTAGVGAGAGAGAGAFKPVDTGYNSDSSIEEYMHPGTSLQTVYARSPSPDRGEIWRMSPTYTTAKNLGKTRVVYGLDKYLTMAKPDPKGKSRKLIFSFPSSGSLTKDQLNSILKIASLRLSNVLIPGTLKYQKFISGETVLELSLVNVKQAKASCASAKGGTVVSDLPKGTFTAWVKK